MSKETKKYETGNHLLLRVLKDNFENELKLSEKRLEEYEDLNDFETYKMQVEQLNIDINKLNCVNLLLEYEKENWITEKQTLNHQDQHAGVTYHSQLWKWRD